MKKNISLFLLLSCMFLLGACVDDKGNYNYQDKDDIWPVRINGLEDAITIPQGNVLKLSPIVENDNPSQYTYSWFVMESQTSGGAPKRFDIAETKDLEYTVNLSPGSWLLNFRVYDEKKDLFQRKEIRLTVSASPVGLGWYVLKDEDGETDFDYINPDGEVYRDLLFLAGNRPKGIARNMSYQNTRYYHVVYDAEGTATTLSNQSVFYIATDQDFCTYNAKNLDLFKTFNDQFYIAPETINPGRVCYINSGNVFFMNDGQAYSIYGMSANIGKFSSAKICLNPLYNSLLPGGSDEVVVFDEVEHTFYKTNTMSPNLVPVGEITFDEDNVVSFTNMPYSIITMADNTSTYRGFSYAMMKNEETGEGALARYSADKDDFVSFKTVPKDSKLLQSDIIAPSYTADFLYFAIDNKVYDYQNAEGIEGSREKVILEYPGETVAFLRHNFVSSATSTVRTNSLNVLTNTDHGWKLYFYDLTGESTSELASTTPTAVYEGTGNGRFIMFRQF